eukprot:2820926-Pyramimonas_sp.AAC.1
MISSRPPAWFGAIGFAKITDEGGDDDEEDDNQPERTFRWDAEAPDSPPPEVEATGVEETSEFHY